MREKTPADELRSAARSGGAAPLKRLIRELNSVRADMLRLESEAERALRGLHPARADSARNLLHYLSLRRHDLRHVQQQLAALGLSSLGRSESNVMHNLEAVLWVLHQLAGSAGRALEKSRNGVSFDERRRLLDAHTRALFGPEPKRRRVRIMVTMPSEAADDYELVRNLLAQGMNCMRVNCAHDDDATWSRMIENLRRAMRETGKDCRILMDLPGPNPRIGPIEPGPQVITWSPRRDPLGRVEEPARVWLTPDEAATTPPGPADASLPVSGDWLTKSRRGDLVEFLDARGASRSLKVVAAAGAGRWAESAETAYVTTGTTLRLVGPAAKGSRRKGEGQVGELPPLEQRIELREGDALTIWRDHRPGSPAVYDRRGRLVKAASVGVTLPEALAHVREGERVWFDDGIIGGRVVKVGLTRWRSESRTRTPTGKSCEATKASTCRTAAYGCRR